MKTSNIVHFVLLAATALLANCTSTKKNNPAPLPATAASHDAKAPAPVEKSANKSASKASAATATDDLNEYSVTEVSDPLEGLNRATFKFNDRLYAFIVRPISKGYEKAFPRPVRKGLDNAFENVRYPVRLVNCALQGKFKRAGKETEKLIINSVLGLGGLIRVSDKIPSLADVPAEDTGLTFAVWGIGHGAYLVLPFFGPSSMRDGFGLAGDYVLNPINWDLFWHGNHDWLMAVQGANSIRSMPDLFSAYDAATKEAVDPYLSVRSAYIQNRAEAARK